MNQPDFEYAECKNCGREIYKLFGQVLGAPLRNCSGRSMSINPSGRDGRLVNGGQRRGSDLNYYNENDPKGGDMSEWPEDLRVREFPKTN